MLKIKDETGTYVELPRDKITFYGDTEKEREANEQLFDISLELSGLYDENNELKQEIDRLNNKVSELENINEKIGLALDSAENKVDRLNNIIKNTIINDIKSILIMDICDDEKCNLIDKYLKELKEGNK